MTPQRPRTLRAVTYLRLSNHTEASTSIDRQREVTQARCDREGWPVVAELADPNVSGAKARENAATALAMLHDGRADVLVVAALDRWSRAGLTAVAELDAVLSERERAGSPALFVSIRDGLRSDQAAWRIIATVLSEQARAERDNTSARTTASIAKLTAENRWRGGTVPFGYRAERMPEGPGYRLVVDVAAAGVLRDAARRILAGASAYAVVRDMNARCVPTAQGGEWRVSRFVAMLTSPRMVGQVIYRGEVVRDADGLHASVWPPVLEHETWERLRVRLNVDKPPAERPRRRRAARLLSGLLRCHTCGTSLYVNTLRGRPTYQCDALRRGSARCTRTVSVAADKLEASITSGYLAAYGDLPAYERVEIQPEDTGLAEIARAIEATSADLARSATLDTFQRLQALQARRDEIAAAPRTRRVDMRLTGSTSGEMWAAANDDHERRALLEAAYVTILIGPATRTGRNAPVHDRITIMTRPSIVTNGEDAPEYPSGRPVIVIPATHDDAPEGAFAAEHWDDEMVVINSN
jgi:DNA invertase Pin-like site-specific DNA recombinase